MSSGRVAGILFILGGVALGIIGIGWLFTQVSGGSMQSGGAFAGAFLLVLLIFPLVAVGIVLLNRSRREALDAEEQAELRKILDVVESRGEVQVSELVIDLGTSRGEVQDQIHALVGMGLFSGYINWDEGTLYSAEAASIHDLQRCKHCGGEVHFAGKGVLRCQHCGTEYFVS